MKRWSIGVVVKAFDPLVFLLNYLQASKMSTPFGQTIANDHRAVYALRDQYVAAADADTKQELTKLLMWNVARHVTTEEILVHPMCVKFLGTELGGKLAQFDGEGHAEVKQSFIHLLDLGATPGTAEFDGTLEKVLGDLHRHNDSEEASDIPTLEKNMTETQAQELAEAIEGAKEFFVPSRFDESAGVTITEKALRAVLTTDSGALGEDLIEFLGIRPPQKIR